MLSRWNSTVTFVSLKTIYFQLTKRQNEIFIFNFDVKTSTRCRNAGNETLMSVVFLFFARKKDKLTEKQVRRSIFIISLFRNHNFHLFVVSLGHEPSWDEETCRNHLFGNERRRKRRRWWRWLKWKDFREMTQVEMILRAENYMLLFVSLLNDATTFSLWKMFKRWSKEREMSSGAC